MFLSSIFLPRKYCSRKCLSTWSSPEFFLRPPQKTFLNLILIKQMFLRSVFLHRKSCYRKFFPILTVFLPRKCFLTWSSPENVSQLRFPPQGMICCCWLLALLCCLPQAFIFTTREGYDRKIISFQMLQVIEWAWHQSALLVMTVNWLFKAMTMTNSKTSTMTVIILSWSLYAIWLVDCDRMIMINTIGMGMWMSGFRNSSHDKVSFSILWCTLGEFEICTTSYPRWLSAKQYTIGEFF